MYDLIDDIMAQKVSMVFKENFETLINHKENIEKIPGDIVECGCWRGGFSIFLSKMFPQKNIWASDSFQGFQPLSYAKHDYKNERHTPLMSHNSFGPLAISFEETYNNFIDYGLQQDIENGRIQFLQGYVQDTTNPETCKIENIALLRIDVDAYSATLEVLNNLYNKVSPGGYIIFDDSCLRECRDAIRSFFTNNSMNTPLYHPTKDIHLDVFSSYTKDDSGFPPGCFIIKP